MPPEAAEGGGLARVGSCLIAVRLHGSGGAPDTKSRTCLHIDLWTRSEVYFQVTGR